MSKGVESDEELRHGIEEELRGMIRKALKHIDKLVETGEYGKACGALGTLEHALRTIELWKPKR